MPKEQEVRIHARRIRPDEENLKDNKSRGRIRIGNLVISEANAYALRHQLQLMNLTRRRK